MQPRAFESLGAFGAILQLARVVYAQGRRSFQLVLMLALVGGVLPLGIARAGKGIVDAISAQAPNVALLWLSGEFVLAAASAAIARYSTVLLDIVGTRTSATLLDRVLRRTQEEPFESFERSGYDDLVARMRVETLSKPGAMVSDALRAVQALLTFIGSALVAIHSSWWLPCVVVLGAGPAAITELRAANATFATTTWATREGRAVRYAESVLASKEYAPEVRLFGLAEFFLARRDDVISRVRLAEEARARATTHRLNASGLVATASFYSCYAYTVLQVARGQSTLGDLFLLVAALRAGQSAFQLGLTTVVRIYEHGLFLQELFAFIGKPAAPRAPALPPERPPLGRRVVLEFQDVWFRYTDAEDWALSGVSFTVEEGTMLAIVGENGAGKSTLVKLLLGLYTPARGRVLIDGRDLATVGPGERRDLLTAVFQDFSRYQLTLRENVVLDDAPGDGEVARVLGAVGLRAVVDEHGLDAQLGPWFDGAELSGGQWQRVALARALCRRTARVCVLDEPTSALDPESDEELHACVRATLDRRVAVWITHRMGTARRAERILVLSCGQVQAMGTHRELMAQRGSYAAWYEMQAAAFAPSARPS